MDSSLSYRPYEMTPTKRKRLYVEAGRPYPGDHVKFYNGTVLYVSPKPSSRSLCTLGSASIGLVLGTDEFLEWLLVLVNRQGTMRLGWIEIKKVNTTIEEFTRWHNSKLTTPTK